MKSKYIFAAILVLFIVALAGISPVLATSYECTLFITQKQNLVVVWTFATPEFSGKDITAISAEYYHYATDTIISLTPTQIHYTTKSVELIFKADSLNGLPLPEDRNSLLDHTYVRGYINGVDTFIAYGPGFTYRTR